MGGFFVNRWFHMILLLALLVSAVFVRLQDYEWSRALRYIAFDTFNVMHPRAQTDSLVIVDIDELSMGRDNLGQWPWPRHIVARMVDSLRDMGARAIVFDMVFAENDRTSPQMFLKTLPDENMTDELRSSLSSLEDHDAALAESFSAAGNVVAGFIWTSNPEATRRKPVLSKPIPLTREAAHLKDTVPQMAGVTTTIPELAEAAAGNGCFGVSTEIDGLIRQVPLLFGMEGALYPSLALEAVRVAQDPRLLTKVRGLRGDELGLLDPPLLMQVGEYEIPFDDDGKFFVYFSKQRPEKYIPAWKVLEGAVERTAIDGKIVLVGTSAEGLKDIRSTPLDLFVPGVEVHANVIEQILTGQYLKRPMILHGVEIVFMVAIGLMIILMAPFIGAVILAGLTMVLVCGIGYASWHIFLHHGLLLDPVYPSLSILALFVLAALLAYIRTEAEKRQVRDAFSHYISPDFMRELTADPDKLKLGGEVRELTVMFTDIRGFTGISERLSPEALIQLMNDFLTPMSALVMENRGTIDKYMGDAMMAFWNAPLDDAHHARHACVSALKMDAALAPINERLRAQAGEGPALVLAAGIGINTGLASVGNMGSKQRFAYSALGDTVNLASRLEGQTKAYGVSIMIGEETARQVPEMALLELDLLRVKGKSAPVRVYTLVGDAELADTDAFRAWQADHARMVAAYRAMDWDAAQRLIELCRRLSAGQMMAYYDIFYSRIALLKKNRPDHNDWDGVFLATDK